MPDLSVIIPAYNEERRLPATLASVHEYLSAQAGTFEILVVDDGSLDQTAAVVEAFGKGHGQVRLVSYSPNKGKGHAVRVGMLKASGDLILINDADGSSPISELPRVKHAIAAGADLAIGSRAKPDRQRVVNALPYRKYIGNTFNLIVQCLLLPGIYDTQCGFKLFKRSVAHDLFSVAHLDGFGFDVEILFIARLRGYSVSEIAIDWSNVEGSKVNVLIDSPKMLMEVLWIAAGAWFGRYKRLSKSTALRIGLNGSLMGSSNKHRDKGRLGKPASQTGTNSELD